MIFKAIEKINDSIFSMFMVEAESKDNAKEIIEKQKPKAEIVDIEELSDSEAARLVRMGMSTIKEKEDVKESYVQDAPGEYTIWSASDFAEEGYQIPLVKIKTDENGELYAEAVGDDNFDQESFKIAVNSLKATAGRPEKDRLLRVDKSLNHADPYVSTELARQYIQANRGTEKKEIKDIVGNVEELSDEPRTPEEQEKYLEKKQTINPQGMSFIASQVLIQDRDDLKALANKKGVKEEDIAEMFKDMTGVNYYTEEVEDEDQYNHVLLLLGRSIDKYHELHVTPDENGYVQGLKNLAKDLIEKVNSKNNPSEK